MTAPDAPLVYTVKEVLAKAKVGRTTFYEDVKAGRLVIKKRGSRTLVEAGELARYVAELPPGAAA